METTYYDVGDVVMLNSQGPLMTVKESFAYENEEGDEIGEGVTCVWFMYGELFEEDFDICMVQIVYYADEVQGWAENTDEEE